MSIPQGPGAAAVRIHLKSKDEIRLMREAGLVAAAILDQVCDAAKPGVSTWELDEIARRGIARHKVTSAFLHYNPGNKPPYPAVLCTSRNEVIVHGIPRKSDVLQDGDIIGIDFGIFKQGFCADTARTLMIGNVSPEKRKLVETCRDALEAAIELCRPGTRLGDLGSEARPGHHGARLGFEGGQMPMPRRIPKRGFKNPFRVETFPINVATLERVFDAGAVVDLDALRAKGLVPKLTEYVKILGEGEITKQLTIKAYRASATAKDKVEKAGGTIEVAG